MRGGEGRGGEGVKVLPQGLSDGERRNYEQNVQDAVSVFPRLPTGLDVNVRFTRCACGGGLVRDAWPVYLSLGALRRLFGVCLALAFLAVSLALSSPQKVECLIC